MKNVKHILVAVGMVALLGAVSCKKFDPWGGEPGTTTGTSTTGTTGTTGGENPDCTMKGKFVSVPCGISDFDNLWILGDDGRYYQPCDASVIHRTDYSVPLVDGTPVMFGYKPMENGCEEETRMLCPNGIPPKIKIRLTCLNPIFRVTLNSCKPVTMVNQINPNRGNVEIMNAYREDNCIKMHVRYSSDKPINADDFNLTWDGTVQKPIPALATLYLDNVPSGIHSQLIQEADISFDVSKIMESVNNNSILIRIDGYNKML